jgi:hypothetical protein
MRTTLKHFQNWEKQQMHEYHTPLGEVRVLVEYNQHYGYLITQFEIGGTIVSSVRNKYIPDSNLFFSESNSRIGDREFENGSMTYEFLLKPLEVPVKERFTDFYSFDEYAKSKGWKHKD